MVIGVALAQPQIPFTGLLSRGSCVFTPVTSPTAPKRPEEAVFQLALAFLLHGYGDYIGEGGYVNNPNDKGGATNQGVTQGSYDSYRSSLGLPSVTVKNISDEEVRSIYRKRYWEPSHCADMPDKLAVAHMDTYSNGGGTVTLNRALGLPDNTQYNANVKAAIAKISDADQFVTSYLDLRDVRFETLAKNDPTQKIFLKGWHNRVKALRQYLATL